MDYNLSIEDLQNDRIYIANDFYKYSKIKDGLYIHAQSIDGELLLPVEHFYKSHGLDKLKELRFVDITDINH